MHLWTEISSLDVQSCQLYLKRRKRVHPHNHLCRTRKHRLYLLNSLAEMLYAAGLASNPRGWYGSSSQGSPKYLPHRAQSQGVLHGSQASKMQSTLSKPALSNQQTVSTSIDMPSNNESFVLFGVKGTRRTLELAQINTRKCMNDFALFRDMRQRYRELRGFLRYWFSIWRFSHCDFVKVCTLCRLSHRFVECAQADHEYQFEKIRAHRIIPRGKGIPTDPNYEYNPRPPDAETTNQPA